MSEYGIAFLEKIDNKKKRWVNASIKDQSGKDLFLFEGTNALRDMIKDDLSYLGKPINWNDPDSLDYASDYIVSRCKEEEEEDFYKPVQDGYTINFAELINYYRSNPRKMDYYINKEVDNPIHIIIDNVTAIMNMMETFDNASDFRVVFWVE